MATHKSTGHITEPARSPAAESGSGHNGSPNENVQPPSDLRALQQQLADALDREIAAREVLGVISRSGAELQPIFDTILKTALQLCRADVANIWRFIDGKLQFAAFDGMEADLADYLQKHPPKLDRGSAAGRSMLTRRTVHIPDVLDDSGYTWTGAQQVGGYRTILGVPLLREGEPIGVISLWRTRVRPFTDKQIELVSTFAEQAAIAIENVRLFEAEQARSVELSEALERQTATSEVLDIISKSPTDTQPVFDAIVQSGSRLFPGSAISIALRVDDLIEAQAIADDDPDRADAWRSIFPVPVARDYMHGLVMLDAKELDVSDVAGSENKDMVGWRNFLSSGYRAVTMVPLLRENEAIGVLSVVRVEPGPLSPEEITLLRAFAAQAVIAIENMRLLNELRQSNSTLANVSAQLAKYVSPQLYRSIIDGQQDVTIASTRKKLTIFFSDIAGFTEITDQLESEELTEILNEYLTEMSRVAEEFGANFDKFIGDAIMCYFGDPESHGVKEDAAACVRMALEMQRQLGLLEASWRKKGLIDHPVQVRMGINTGYCTVGNFGSPDRMDNTIIGQEVNLAARLEAHADAGGILMAVETYSLVKDWLLADEQEAISVKGFSNPVRTFRVRGSLEALAKDQNYFHHEEDGVVISISGDRADKESARSALKKALEQLNH